MAATKPSPLTRTKKAEAAQERVRRKAEREGRPQSPVDGTPGPVGATWVGGGWHVPAPELPPWEKGKPEFEVPGVGLTLEPDRAVLELAFRTAPGAPLYGRLVTAGLAELEPKIREALAKDPASLKARRAKALLAEARKEEAEATAAAVAAVKEVEALEAQWLDEDGPGVRGVIDARKKVVETEHARSAAHSVVVQALKEALTADAAARRAITEAVRRASRELVEEATRKAEDALRAFVEAHSAELGEVALAQQLRRVLHTPASTVQGTLFGGLANEVLGPEPDAPPLTPKALPPGSWPDELPPQVAGHLPDVLTGSLK
jgi:hypothetical protein